MERKNQDGESYELFALLDADGNVIGRLMPLPTSSVANQDELILKGKVFVVGKVTQAAASGKISRLQLWNPTGSGKTYIAAAVSAWGNTGDGSNVWQMSKTSTPTVGGSDQSGLWTNANSAFSDSCALKIYTDTQQSTVPNKTGFPQITVASTTSQGSAIIASSKNAIGEGKGLDIEITTVNKTLNLYLIVFEFDNQ